MSDESALRFPRADWHRGVSVIVFAWMGLAVLGFLLRDQLEHWGWFSVHFLLLGAVSNALFIWMWHFTGAILRVPDQADRADEIRRLVLLNAGAVGTIIGVGTHARAVILGSAAFVIAAVVLLGLAVRRAIRRALPSPYAFTAQAYMAAVSLLIPGLLIGATLASTEIDEHLEPRLVLAHVTFNLLGWIGIPILGTIVTLWPTMLRTRIAPDAARLARRALPWLLGATTLACLGIVLDRGWLAASGLFVYLAASAVIVSPMLTVARTKPPRSFATQSAAAGLVWLLGTVLVFALSLLQWGAFATEEEGAVLLLLAVAGGILQVLLGCLSYLLPAMAAGGPAMVRWRNDRAERGAAVRLALANVGLVLAVVGAGAARISGATVMGAGFVWTVVVIASSMRRPSADEVAAADARRIAAGEMKG